jgi:hypothetical protein
MIAWLEELNRAIIDYSPASEKGYAIQMHYGIYFLRHGDQLADKALYNAIQAKEYARLKRMQYAVFDDEVLREAKEYQAFEQEVLSGLENKEFVPFFQPLSTFVPAKLSERKPSPAGKAGAGDYYARPALFPNWRSTI